MARTWTVRRRRLVQADLPSVVRWCTDDRRLLEWQERLQAAYRAPIEWRETRDGDSLIHEGVWRTRRGNQIRYWVTRHRPPFTPTQQTHELRQETLSEILTPFGGRSVTEGTSRIRLTAHEPDVTEIAYEQRWRTVERSGSMRIPFLDAFRLRRSVDEYLERCASAMHNPTGRRA